MNETTNEVTATEHQNKMGYLVSGMVLVTLGVLFLLDRFDVADFGDVIRTWWPLFVIVPAIPKLFRRETLWSGLWMLTMGIWFQFVTLRLFGLTWSNSWPIVLIAAGAGMIARTLIESSARRNRHES